MPSRGLSADVNEATELEDKSIEIIHTGAGEMACQVEVPAAKPDLNFISRSHMVKGDN